MINSKKRPASSADSGEPIKKKIPKFDKQNSNKTKPTSGTFKPNKFNKNAKGPLGKAGSGGPKGKFDAKNGKFKKFDNKKFGATGNDEKAQAPEKTDWAKFKQEKKDLKLKRKKSKDHYEIVAEAKKIYERLKCRRTENKQALVLELFNMLNKDDTLKKVVMAHDTARILQCMLKFANPVVRDQLSEKLMPMALEMCVSKYSHFCVLRMVKYGSPSTKSKLVDSLLGHIVRLSCHTISSKILDHIYLNLASNKQKAFMRQEFYGDLYKKAKDNNVKTLSDTYKEAEGMKASILSAVKSNIEHVANKNLLDNSLVHAVLWEYLQAVDEEKLEEAISFYASMIPHLLTTKEGTQASTFCFYKASTKNRRAIVKAIKEHLIKICVHEHGHVFLIAILNALDDTKAIKKAIFDVIYPEMQSLMSNQYGRKVIEWLVSPADTNCFHPAFIAKIEEGLQFSKKDKEVRRKEISEQIEGPMSEALVQNPAFYVSDGHVGLVTAEILKSLKGDLFVNASTALCGIIVDPKWSVTIEEEAKDSKKSKDIEKIIEEANKLKKKKKIIENDEEKEEKDGEESSDEEEETKEEVKDVKTVPGIEEPGLHIALKKIIKNDKNILQDNPENQTFGSILVSQLTDDTLRYWLTVNRACFVLLNVVEQNHQSTNEALKELLTNHKGLLKKQKTKGAQLLQEKLSA